MIEKPEKLVAGSLLPDLEAAPKTESHLNRVGSVSENQNSMEMEEKLSEPEQK